MRLAGLQSQGIKDAENALDYAGGAPLLALQIAEEGEVSSNLVKNLALGAKLDAFACAPLFLSIGMERALETLQKWVFDLAGYKLAQTLRYHPQQGERFASLV